MKVNIQLLVKHLQDKMYAEMAEKRQTFGLRYFAEVIGTSAPTLSRIIKGGESEIKLATFINIVVYIGGKTDDYLIMEYQ